VQAGCRNSSGAAYQGHVQKNSRRGDDTIWQVWNLSSWHLTESPGYGAVNGYLTEQAIASGKSIEY
jgi:hypothetical protein